MISFINLRIYSAKDIQRGKQTKRITCRAAECWDENVVTHMLDVGFDIKGNEHFKKLNHDIHDTLEGIFPIICN